jgi:phosphopantothenoylcysteine decarboxylase / phosphopantothenate---cysteine ligase
MPIRLEIQTQTGVLCHRPLRQGRMKMHHEWEPATQLQILEPSNDRGVTELSGALKNARIALCIGGGIAAIEAPRIARALRRLGATVQAFATEGALKFIGSQSIEWATANPLVVTPSGLAEHVTNHDLVFVSCATADIIGKAAHGICNDGVTTLIQSALGSKIPVVFAQTMHESLAASPIVSENIERLRQLPLVKFLRPRFHEAKLKSRMPEDLADEVAHIHNRWGQDTRSAVPANNPHHRRVLLTYGGTKTPIDAVRAISNLSTGSLGNEFLRELYRWGFEIEALQADVSVPTPDLEHLTVVPARTYADMYNKFCSTDPRRFIGVFMLAAISDYVMNSETRARKIPSSQSELKLNLVPAEKLIKLEQFKSFPFRFAAKLTEDSGEAAQNSIAQLASNSQAQYIFWNTIDEAFGQKQVCGRIWDTRTKATDAIPFTSKSSVARTAVDLLRKSLLPNSSH